MRRYVVGKSWIYGSEITGTSAYSVFFETFHYIYTGCWQKMVPFQKLTRNLFLTLHGQNVHRQQRQLSKFLMRYQQFASHA